MNNSISINGLLFIFWLFLMIILFFMLGGAIDAIFDALVDSAAGHSADETLQYVPNYKLAARMAFAIGISTPVVWFIAKMFSREPATFRNRRF